MQRQTYLVEGARGFSTFYSTLREIQEWARRYAEVRDYPVTVWTTPLCGVTYHPDGSTSAPQEVAR